MSHENDVLAIILGCESYAQFAQCKSVFATHHGNVQIEQAPFSPYRFTERLTRCKIVEMISCTSKQYVALLESNFLKDDCVREDLMALYSQKCGGDTVLLCHPTNGGKDMFRPSRRFMVADDACFGKKDDILKHVLYENECPTKE